MPSQATGNQVVLTLQRVPAHLFDKIDLVAIGEATAALALTLLATTERRGIPSGQSHRSFWTPEYITAVHRVGDSEFYKW